ITEFLERSGHRAKTIAVEDGHSLYLPEGMITHHEYQSLKAANPDAELVNFTKQIDYHMLIKDKAQIARMRQACAMCDAAQLALKERVRPGMSEVEIAGIAEQVLRDEGSEFAWT